MSWCSIPPRSRIMRRSTSRGSSRPGSRTCSSTASRCSRTASTPAPRPDVWCGGQAGPAGPAEGRAGANRLFSKFPQSFAQKGRWRHGTVVGAGGFCHMGDNAEIIENMWARIEQCRRLAALIHNPEASRMLLEMAEKGEADVKKLIAEH